MRWDHQPGRGTSHVRLGAPGHPPPGGGGGSPSALGRVRELVQPQFGPRRRAPVVAEPVVVKGVIGAVALVLDEVYLKFPVGHGHVDLLEIDLRRLPQ